MYNHIKYNLQNPTIQDYTVLNSHCTRVYIYWKDLKISKRKLQWLKALGVQAVTLSQPGTGTQAN